MQVNSGERRAGGSARCGKRKRHFPECGHRVLRSTAPHGSLQPPASLPAHTRVQSPWRRGFWERGDFKRWSGEGSEKDRHIGHVRSVRCTLGGVGASGGGVGRAASAASGDMVNGLLCLSISVSGRGLSGYGRRRANAPGPLYFGACSLNFRIFSEHSPNISRTCSPPLRAHHAAELVPTIFRTLAEHPPEHFPPHFRRLFGLGLHLHPTLARRPLSYLPNFFCLSESPDHRVILPVLAVFRFVLGRLRDVKGFQVDGVIRPRVRHRELDRTCYGSSFVFWASCQHPAGFFCLPEHGVPVVVPKLRKPHPPHEHCGRVFGRRHRTCEYELSRGPRDLLQNHWFCRVSGSRGPWDSSYSDARRHQGTSTS